MSAVLRRLAFVALSVAGFLLIWKAVVVIGGYPEYILPAPEVVLARAVEAVQSGTLQPHLAATLQESVLGFTVGMP